MLAYLFKLFVTATVIFAVVFWWKTQGLKQRALWAAQQRCEELNLQLLDQSVSLRSFKFTRGPNGSMAILRRFSFEFSSSGADRYRGRVELLGNRILGVELEPHRFG